MLRPAYSKPSPISYSDVTPVVGAKCITYVRSRCKQIWRTCSMLALTAVHISSTRISSTSAPCASSTIAADARSRRTSCTCCRVNCGVGHGQVWSTTPAYYSLCGAVVGSEVSKLASAAAQEQLVSAIPIAATYVCIRVHTCSGTDKMSHPLLRLSIDLLHVDAQPFAGKGTRIFDACKFGRHNH